MQPLTLQASKFFFDRMLPIRIYYTRCSEVADWHTHDFSEIAIILSGSAVYETDFSTSRITAGDVLVMPAGGSHRFHSEVDIEQFNLLFQFEKLPVPGKDITMHPGYSSLFRLNPEYCRKQKYYPRFRIRDAASLQYIRLLLTAASTAQEQKKTGYALSVYGAFLQIIPILLENYSSCVLRQNAHIPELLADCLDHIQQNFRKELPTALLAEKAKMAPASFVRHFHAATGMTPLEYIIKLRLEEAAILLQDPDLSIAEAALQSGFNDSNYFSRLFRKKNNISPRGYRKMLGLQQ